MTEKIYKYVAFISYRHIQPDFEIASQIHKAIENFKVPKELDPHGKYKDMRVFRDREELTTKDLSESLDEALRESEYLIIICSRKTPDSPWCTREVEEFKKYHEDSKIIPILIEGEPYESFNEELQNLKSVFIDDKGEEQVRDLELLAADLRPDEVKKLDFVGYEYLEKNDKAKFESLRKESLKILKQSEIYRIMATILGVNFGDLKQRHKERRLRTIIASTVAAALILLAFGISMTNLYFQAERAKQTATQQTSMMVLKSADTAISEGNRAFSLLVSKEAMKNITPDMENYNQLEANYTRILNDALLSPKFSTMQLIDSDSTTPRFSVSNKRGYLITGGELSTGNIWDISNGELVKRIELNSPISAITIDKEDEYFYIATRGGEILKYNLDTLEYEEIFSSSGSYIQEMGFTKEGNYLILIAGMRDVIILDRNTYEIAGSFKLDNYEETITNISSLTGEKKFIVADSMGRIMIYDLDENKYVEVIESTTEKTNFRNTVLSPDSKYYAYSDDFSIKIFNTHTGEKTVIEEYTNGLYFSPDSKILFGTSTNSIASWNIEDGSVYSYFFTPSNVERMRISQDGNTLVVALSKDHSIGIFEDIKNKPELGSFQMVESPGSTHGDSVYGIYTTDDEKYIITSSVDSTIRIINRESTLSQRNIVGNIKAVSQDNNLILILDKDGNIKIYNFEKDEETTLGNISNSRFTTMINQYVISNDGNYIGITDISTATAQIMNREGNILYTTKDHSQIDQYSVIQDIAISETDQILYTLGIQGEVYKTDLKTGEILKTIKDKDELGSYFVLSEDGSLMALVYYSGEVSLINTNTGEAIDRIQGDVYKVFGEEGKLDKVFGQMGKRLFEYKNGEMGFYASNDERKGLTTEERIENYVSYDGKYLITNVAGNSTIVTDLETGYRVRTLPKKENYIFNSMGTMNKDNSKIAYDYDDNEVVITEFYSTEDLEKMASNLTKERKLTDEERNEIGLINRAVENEE
jgi:sugar lactone lactonase YvrE